MRKVLDSAKRLISHYGEQWMNKAVDRRQKQLEKNHPGLSVVCRGAVFFVCVCACVIAMERSENLVTGYIKHTSCKRLPKLWLWRRNVENWSCPHALSFFFNLRWYLENALSINGCSNHGRRRRRGGVMAEKWPPLSFFFLPLFCTSAKTKRDIGFFSGLNWIMYAYFNLGMMKQFWPFSTCESRGGLHFLHVWIIQTTRWKVWEYLLLYFFFLFFPLKSKRAGFLFKMSPW